MSYLSLHRVWKNCFVLGVGVAWCREDRTACLLIQAGFWLVTIGPHIYKGEGE